MKTRGGPRQPGGGRQRPGPRHRPRSDRSGAPAPAAKRAPSEARHRLPSSAKSDTGSRKVDAKTSDLAAASAVQTVTVSPDESGMRVDRFLEARFSGLSFSHIQRIIRKGELRVNGRRVDGKDRLQAGQAVRIPPLRLDQPKPRTSGSEADEKTRTFLRSITLHEDDDVLVLNKPMGLAVQGGPGMTRHVDGMLEVLRDRDGQRPRLVHRLDKDTAGCLLVAKSRFAAAAKRVFATSRQPAVSLSSRCTSRGR